MTFPRPTGAAALEFPATAPPAARRRVRAPALARRLFGPAFASGRISLALQGGGAHGAFTWGVLDELLADGRFEFEGLSGSSAGAMNAVVMADGWRQGGRDGARAALAAFWGAVGKHLPIGWPASADGGDAIALASAGKLLTGWARHFSPMQLNPFDLNPLRDLLRRQIDFERLRAASPFKLFVGTTEANTGKLRVFREKELSVDVLLASACLPKIHHPVEIDGKAYWDGGFSANPAVFPLFYDCESPDVLLVLLAPLMREDTPRTVAEIDARISELGFSTHFLREMRTFAQAARFARPGFLQGGRLERRLRELRFHMIDSTGLPAFERTDTKQLAYGPFLERWREQGAERTRQWLADAAGGVGRHSTLDIERWFG